MLMCLCYGVSCHEIKTLIQDGAMTTEDVQLRCGAGMGCGCCLEALQNLVSQESTSILQSTKSSSHAFAGKGNSQGQCP